MVTFVCLIEGFKNTAVIIIINPFGVPHHQKLFGVLVGVVMDNRWLESTVSAQDYLIHSRHALNIKVEEMGEDFEVPDHDFEEGGDADGSETDSVENTQLNEPFSCKDLVSHYNVSRFQLTPNSYCLILGFYVMYMEYVHGKPTMEDFSYFYDIISVGHENGFYYFCKWGNSEINGVEGTVSNMGDWKLKLFYSFKVPGVRTDFNRQTKMTFLKQAPILIRKPKVATTTTSPIIPQKRKSNDVPTPVADLSKKQHKSAQDKGKNVMIDPAVRAHNIIALQDKFVTDEFVSKIEGVPAKDFFPRSTELASQSMTMFSRDFVAGSKELDLLRKQNMLLQDGMKKLKLDVTSKDKDIEDLVKAKEQAEENAAEIADAFRAMSQTKTPGLGGNLFLEDAKNLNAEEVANGTVNKIADDPNTQAS
uniref:Uncharacterized protein n=1 Tax=Cannabis sativa TaxID=3483 RepID=A0A803PT63_CANSA